MTNNQTIKGKGENEMTNKRQIVGYAEEIRKGQYRLVPEYGPWPNPFQLTKAEAAAIADLPPDCIASALLDGDDDPEMEMVTAEAERLQAHILETKRLPENPTWLHYRIICESIEGETIGNRAIETAGSKVRQAYATPWGVGTSRSSI
jgi:hypothetical protein